MSINVTDISNRSLLIDDLMEFTNYSVKVTAVTVGEGPYSDPVTVVTDQDSKFILCAHVYLICAQTSSW